MDTKHSISLCNLANGELLYAKLVRRICSTEIPRQIRKAEINIEETLRFESELRNSKLICHLSDVIS